MTSLAALLLPLASESQGTHSNIPIIRNRNSFVCFELKSFRACHPKFAVLQHILMIQTMSQINRTLLPWPRKADIHGASTIPNATETETTSIPAARAAVNICSPVRSLLNEKEFVFLATEFTEAEVELIFIVAALPSSCSAVSTTTLYLDMIEREGVRRRSKKEEACYFDFSAWMIVCCCFVLLIVFSKFLSCYFALLALACPCSLLCGSDSFSFFFLTRSLEHVKKNF